MAQLLGNVMAHWTGDVVAQCFRYAVAQWFVDVVVHWSGDVQPGLLQGWEFAHQFSE